MPDKYLKPTEPDRPKAENDDEMDEEGEEMKVNRLGGAPKPKVSPVKNKDAKPVLNQGMEPAFEIQVAFNRVEAANGNDDDDDVWEPAGL